MMRQTGGSEVEATSTRSIPASFGKGNSLVALQNTQLFPIGADDAHFAGADHLVARTPSCGMSRRGLMLGEAIAHPSILERLFAVRTDQGSHFRHGLEPQVVPIAQTHIDAARLRFLFPNHQNIRYLGQLRLAHL